MFDAAAPAPNFEPDWNKPPTAPMLVAIRSEDGKRIPKMMRWGLLPHWAKDEKICYSTFNARSEDFTTKPAFQRRLEAGAALPCRHRRLLRVEEDHRSKRSSLTRSRWPRA